jgi:phage FluMu protein Com
MFDALDERAGRLGLSMELKKKCPFCGRRPRLVKGRRRSEKHKSLYPELDARFGVWLWRPAIKCDRCKFGREFDSVEEAVAWWETRKA